MPKELPEVLKYGPLRWPQYDPGPPWWFEVVSKEIQVELVLSQLQLEKEVLASQSKAIDRQIQALQGQKR
jgi:hypothetical protein